MSCNVEKVEFPNLASVPPWTSPEIFVAKNLPVVVPLTEVKFWSEVEPVIRRSDLNVDKPLLPDNIDNAELPI